MQHSFQAMSFSGHRKIKAKPSCHIQSMCSPEVCENQVIPFSASQEITKDMRFLEQKYDSIIMSIILIIAHKV